MPRSPPPILSAEPDRDRGQMKRLYGAMILLYHLNEHLNAANTTQPRPDSELPAERPPREVYHGFVNKIAHICDWKQGGSYVTAASILQYDGTIEYWLAANSRTKAETKKVEGFLKEQILGFLEGRGDEDLNDAVREREIRSVLLRKIVFSNRQRIHAYLKTLVGNIDFAIDGSQEEGSPEAMATSQHLASIKALAIEAQDQWPDGIEFAISMQHLLEDMEGRYENFQQYLRHRAGDEVTAARLTKWGHLRHAIGRLHSYSLATLALVEARRRWPELFKGVKVKHIPSEPRRKKPIDMKEHQCTGNQILRVLNVKPELERNYNGINFSIQGKINEGVLGHIKSKPSEDTEDQSGEDRAQSQPKSKFNYTLVHAELNLFDTITRRRNEEEGVFFFNEASFGMYIGCSKPTCLLCQMFFEKHPLKVLHRSPHNNLYLQWRVPPGTDRSVVEGIAEELKLRVTHAITQQVGQRPSRYDSRHTPSSNAIGNNTLGRGGMAPTMANLAAHNKFYNESVSEEEEDSDSETLNQLSRLEISPRNGEGTTSSTSQSDSATNEG